MSEIECGAYGMTQDTFDMLPKTGFVIACWELWPFCWD